MNTTNHGHTRDRIAELFGASAEREAFEHTARERADEPQTALIPSIPPTPTVIPITITITICSAC